MYSEDARQGGASATLASQSAVLPVLVLYETALSASSTYQTWLKSTEFGAADQKELLVYDNSRSRQMSKEEEGRLLAYFHDPMNGGLASAYNWALQIAVVRGYQWIMLLDQDSKLSLDFVLRTVDCAGRYAEFERVAAIVPHLRSKGVNISPLFVHACYRTSVPEMFHGVPEKQITALNSGTALRTSFAARIGGFPSKYRLDMLDHWLFARIHRTGHCAAVSDVVIEHDLSVSDFRNNISMDRYKSILSAESVFVREEGGRLTRALYPIQLFARSLKQLFVYRRPSFGVQTLRTALRSVFDTHLPHSWGMRPTGTR